jgi:hypothetical protein
MANINRHEKGASGDSRGPGIFFAPCISVIDNYVNTNMISRRDCRRSQIVKSLSNPWRHFSIGSQFLVMPRDVSLRQKLHFKPRRNCYFCDKAATGQADQDIVLLLGKFFPSCDGNKKYTPSELFAASCCLYSKLNIFDFCHIQGLGFFASALSDFRRSPTRFGQPNSRSLGSTASIDFIDLTWNSSLLSFRFVAFRVLDSI